MNMYFRSYLLSFTFLTISILTPGQTKNQNLSNGNIFEGEPFLSINPNNSQHLVVAWMGFDFPDRIAIFTRTSFDGGKTWLQKVKIPHENLVFSSADPCMDFDSDGNIYLVYIDFLRPAEITQSGKLLIRKSTDGGLTWEESITIMDVNSDPGKKALDRPWIAVDKSGNENSSTIYVTSMNAKGVVTPPFNPYVHISYDGGNTWQPWQYLDTTNWLSGNIIKQPMPTPTVSANGTFSAIYPSWVFSQSLFARYIHVSSSDGGKTFEYHPVFNVNSPPQDTVSKHGYLLINNPADENHLAFFYFAKTHGDTDVFMRESFDLGKSWSTAIRVNDDVIGNNRLQDLVWADFNKNGDIAVTWRDRRNATDSTFFTSSEIWGTIRLKNTENFSTNFKISDELVPYDTILGAASGNDFMSCSMVEDTLYAVWGSNQDGTLDIWFQKIQTKNGIPTSIKYFRELNQSSISIFPNPAKKTITICGEKIQTVWLYSAQGKLVMKKKTNSDSPILDISNQPKGTYFLRIKSESDTHQQRFIKY